MSPEFSHISESISSGRSPDPSQVVFIAEDDDAMRRLLVEAFSRNGYRVEEASSGRELFEKMEARGAARDQPSLVVSDIMMPGLDGLDVVIRLRRTGVLAPIILITAFGSDETLLAARERGATAVFSKPFDMDDLLTAARCLASPRTSD